LFDVIVRNIMGVPESIVEPVRLGMRIMIFWSGAIAWRRFIQGIMIRFGMTKQIGQGTIVRLLVSISTALTLAWWGTIPGVAVGAYALITGVIVEAAFAQWIARDLIRQKFSLPLESLENIPHLSYSELVKFHAPLAASSLLFLLAQPLISAALARIPNPEAALAAWPVAAGVLFFTRAPLLALPEVIIALIDEGKQSGTDSFIAKPNVRASAMYRRLESFIQSNGASHTLRNFSLYAGVVCMAVLALVSFTPLTHFYFRTLIGVSEDLAAVAVVGGQVGVLIPLVMGYQSWLRGVLTSKRATLPMTIAMGVNLTTMAITLTIGVILNTPGVPLAALAILISMSAETVVLWVASKRINI
jgi:hypothetical protein